MRPSASAAAGWSALAVAVALWAGCVLDLDRLSGGGGGGAGGLGDAGGGGSGRCCLGVGETSCLPCSDACKAGDCGGAPCVLAEGLGGPEGVIVAGDQVLWTSREGGEIGRLDLTTGAKDTLVTGVAGPTLLTVSGELAVWVAEDGIWQCPFASVDCVTGRKRVCGLTAMQAGRVRGLAADDQTAYWTEDNGAPSGSPVLRCPLATGCEHDAAVFSSNNATPRGIVADAAPAGYVYWANAFTTASQGTVLRMRKAAARDGAFDTVASGLSFPSAVALSGGDLVLTTEPGSDPGAVKRCPQGGGVPCVDVALAPMAGEPGIVGARHLAAGAAQVFWTNSGSGAVMSIALPGGNGFPTVVASAQEDPRGLALSESCVYWVDQAKGGRLLRKAR